MKHSGEKNTIWSFLLFIQPCDLPKRNACSFWSLTLLLLPGQRYPSMCVSLLDGSQCTYFHVTQGSVMFKPLACYFHVIISTCGVQFIHVHAQSDDSVSMQLKAALSHRAAVTSSWGELTPSHFSALSVKRPVTGSRWWNRGILRYYF